MKMTIYLLTIFWQSDIDILEILFDNGDENTIATFTFNGLKVRLNLHQEILSRSLKRLKELGLVDKNETGYNLNKKGKLLFSELKNILNEKISNQTKYTQIIQLSVPFQIPNQQIVQNLSGKYFGSLRWIQNDSKYQRVSIKMERYRRFYGNNITFI